MNLRRFLPLFIASCGAPVVIEPHPIDASIDGIASMDAETVVDASIDAEAPLDAALPIDSSVDSDVTDAGPAPSDATHVNGSFAVGVFTPSGVNCSPNGSRIDEMRIQLFTGAGLCVGTTFRIENFGSITAGCVLPTSMQCIESNSRIISGPLPTGAYHLIVDGMRAGHLCWRGDASIGVQGDGVPSEQPLVLLAQADTCGDVP